METESVSHNLRGRLATQRERGEVEPPPRPPSTEGLALARREILELLRLAPGWDLYSSSRISTDAVARALELLDAAVPPGCPTPSILPMARGGIQLEWHLRNLNIEVTIPPDGSPIEVWYEDLLDRSEHEYLVDDDLRPLRDVLTMLTLRH